jgi:hypothetical protein
MSGGAWEKAPRRILTAERSVRTDTRSRNFSGCYKPNTFHYAVPIRDSTTAVSREISSHIRLWLEFNFNPTLSCFSSIIADRFAYAFPRTRSMRHFFVEWTSHASHQAS